MPNYTYQCRECSYEEDHRMTIAQLDIITVVCPDCDKEMERLVFSPMVMRVGLPDGTRRKGFDRMKEAAKLEVERANTDSKSTKHKELGQAIRKIKSTKD